MSFVFNQDEIVKILATHIAQNVLHRSAYFTMTIDLVGNEPYQIRVTANEQDALIEDTKTP